MNIEKKYKANETGKSRENILFLTLNSNLEENAKALKAQREYHQASKAYRQGLITGKEKEQYKKILNQENNKGIWGDIRLLARRNWWIKNVFSDRIFRELKQKGLILNASMGHNLIPTVGRAVVAELLSGGATYTGEVTDGALGNGVSPTFTNASTQLNSEVGRKASSDASFDDNITYIDFFFASGDIADGTYTEWGTFIDGDGITPNDGQAFSLIATGGWVKSGSIYVSSKYTVTN